MTACPHCRSRREGGPCRVTRCLGCGTRQCMSHGLARGTCAVCYYGHLEGWSWGLKGRPECGYKKCKNPAVFVNVPRIQACCEECASRPKIMTKEGRLPLKDAVALFVQERKWRHERTDG